MNGDISGLPYWEVEFDQAGALLRDGGLAAELNGRPIRDLYVFSHGWNTSQSSAQRLYRSMFALIADALPSGSKASTGFAGILWPSLLFPEDEPATTGPVMTQGDTLAAPPAAAPGAGPPPSSGKELAAAMERAFPGRQAELAELGALLDARPQDPDQLERFHALTCALVTSPAQGQEDSGEARAMTSPPGLVFDSMASLAPQTQQAQGFNPFEKLWAGARETLRALSYYEMKNRAGVVGRDGLGPLLAHLAGGGLRVHLMGHSFGARLASYALLNLPAPTPVKSLFLIQAAFSHFAFARQAPVNAGSGALSTLTGRVDGPLVCTFSTFDRALSWWYPTASRFAGQDAQAVESLNFRWGALGFDGYQHQGGDVTDAALSPRGHAYDFQPGRFYRLDANSVVNRRLSLLAGAHSDIEKQEIAWAAISAAGI
ncbi:alpha/beta fold hydrolase [Nonomuraea sp. M3C6]|uniref:Alpha/beta fold hydrolase n=1 Tax=Nonomuraea marmarensis TaxID=3351344 RepID=A0ABW7AU72_9ACTN